MSIQYIFDLDNTVIDSTHRQLYKLNGSLDLDHWLENNTAENIAADKLLPLANEMRRAYDLGYKIIICSARVMSDNDFRFLHNNNLPFHVCLNRKKGDTSPDNILKERLLKRYAVSHVGSWRKFISTSIMYDDNRGVINHLRDLGLRVYNSWKYNLGEKYA